MCGVLEDGCCAVLHRDPWLADLLVEFFDDFTAVAPEKVADSLGWILLLRATMPRLLGLFSNRLDCSLTWTVLDKVLFLLVIQLQGEVSCWITEAT